MRPVVCWECSASILKNHIPNLANHYRQNHPGLQPFSCGNNEEWVNDFKKCLSCDQWYHIDERHSKCTSTPVAKQFLPQETPLADTNVRTMDPYPKTVAQETLESPKLRTYTINKQLKCGECGMHLPQNTIYQLAHHFRTEHPYTRQS